MDALFTSAAMVPPAQDVATSGSSALSGDKSPIAGLKNGKVIFKQKPVSFEKASETMQEIVKFREMLDSRVLNQDQPLTTIPEEHRPLIAKLAQESDKGVVPLAKQIRSILLPGPGEVEDSHRLGLESNLPLSVVGQAIKAVMARVNYGLDAPIGQKLPATVCVWRWEVQDAYKDWLPKSARDSANARLAERIQASAHLRAAFQALSPTEQNAILDPKSIVKHPARDINKSETSDAFANISDDLTQHYTPNDVPMDVAEGDMVSENLIPKGRMKKAPDPEKAAKIRDKEEKRAAKAEKEKKQKEAQDRSRSIMANFFGKYKPLAGDSPIKDPSVPVDPSVDSEFQRMFKPFVLKKDAQIAPHNWFLEGSRSRNTMSGISHMEAIIIDEDTTAQGDSVASLEFIRQSSSSCPRGRKVTSLRTYSPLSIRDTVSQLNDAEIAGDPTQVRRLLFFLRNRQVFPAKVLVFHEDSRPGYYGTWTRNSRIVGSRTPLKRDVLARDYGYDSGEEWEDESPGDADDVIDDGEDDEPDAEDADSDLDSWLVDDDDDVRSPLDPDGLSPPSLDPLPPPPKRKAENIGKQSGKKRKVVVPLVPYMKGPFWESCIGRCEYDSFNAYRMQLFNDTPHPIDPFTFISVASEVQNSQDDPSFPAPLLPGAVQSLADITATSTLKRPTSSIPKTTFPEVHLGTLLAKITDLATPNLTFLVESIYQDLRTYKIKKNAIEAKVREIGEKSKDKKVWVVKPVVQ